jgi:hypothetical protein
MHPGRGRGAETEPGRVPETSQDWPDPEQATTTMPGTGHQAAPGSRDPGAVALRTGGRIGARLTALASVPGAEQPIASRDDGCRQIATDCSAEPCRQALRVASALPVVARAPPTGECRSDVLRCRTLKWLLLSIDIPIRRYA